MFRDVALEKLDANATKSSLLSHVGKACRQPAKIFGFQCLAIGFHK